MAPTATDYLHGLRRLWWVPLITLFIGVGLGMWASDQARSTTITTGNALFTFRIDDPGDESAGSARRAEANVAKSRLSDYVQLARSSPEVRALLDSAGVEEFTTTFSPTGGFEDPGAGALIDLAQSASDVAESASALVSVWVNNGDLSQAEASQLVQDLSREVVRQAVATDARQVTPSLQPEGLITDPQPRQQPAAPAGSGAIPVLLLLTLGLGIVYLLVWHQGRIHSRRDIEQRIGARVLGDLTGRPADAPAIALALGKGREVGTTALLVPAGLRPSSLATGVGQEVAAAGRDLGLKVTYTPIGFGTSPQGPVARTGAELIPGEPNEPPPHSLTLFDAPAGLDAESLLSATAVDVVALVVMYGATSYSDLTAAGRSLAEVTGAEIVVIGVRSSANL